MRRMQSSLIILVLALVGCAGDSEPDSAPSTASSPRVATPLTSAEVTAYRQELAQVFAAKHGAVALERSASGGINADVEGHANVALVKVDAEGGLSTTCVDSEQDAIQFLTASDGSEVK